MRLIIYDVGKYIHIPGFASIRTPVKLEIGNRSRQLIEMYLRSNGIIKFEIVESNYKNTDSLQSSGHLPPTPTVEVNVNNDNDEIKNKLNRLEDLILSLMDKPSQTVIYNTTTSTNTESIKSEKEYEDIDDDFIPSISLDGIEQKNVLTSGTKLCKDSDIEELAEMLKRGIEHG